MKKAEIEISVRQVPQADGATNLVEVRHGEIGNRSARTFTVEFQHSNAEVLEASPLLDGYVFGLLPLSMEGADRLIVRGPVSTAAMRNAWTLGEAWHAWFPHLYRPVEIVPDETWSESDVIAHGRLPKIEAAIAAFSGGVDSTFTALRHSNGSLGTAAFPLSDLCMIHGFDVRLDNPVDFAGLMARTQPFVDHVGLRLHVVRTNLREITQPMWEHAHGLHLACVLHQFSGQFSSGLIASEDSSFRHPPIEWGSTPATDPLMSGGAFRIVHDGAGYSRSNKVAFLADCVEARIALKVCFSGSRKDRNCGRCFKCVRTHLIFLALGVDHPECFSEPLTAADVEGLFWPTARPVQLLKDLLAFARSLNSQHPLFDVLANRIDELGRPAYSHGTARVPSSSTHGLVRRLSDYRRTLGDWLHSMGRIRVLSGMPGNIGDHLIWRGTETLLHMEGVEFDTIEFDVLGGTPSTPVGGTLVIPGSGALTAHWHEWLPAFVKAAAQQFERVVLLPSEYEPNVPVVHEALLQPNVYAFARDAASYRKIRSYGRASLALDPALYTFEFQNKTHVPRSDDDLGTVLVALRTDRSSLLSDRGLHPCAMNEDISMSRTNLSSFLEAIEGADSVVTDRLHVTVAATMLGKNVRFFDPAGEKISRYVSFTFGAEFSPRLNQRDESWLLHHGFVTRSRLSP